MSGRTRQGFTIIELLVVVSVIALLMAILLPAITKARDQTKLTVSFANLRNLATAHQSYAAEWKDRQFTLVNDNISSYGGDITAFHTYYLQRGGETEDQAHPAPILGWGFLHRSGRWALFIYRTHEVNAEERHDGVFNPRNCSLNLPIKFASPLMYFGSFRLANMEQFHQYVGGKFYDPVFYPPKDKISLWGITGEGEDGHNCFEDPGQFCDRSADGPTDTPIWAGYVLSPAAMFAPNVMAHDDPANDKYNGWVSPWLMPAGFRSPSFSQALYPALKTHMLEHHWLQNALAECNPGFSGSTYDLCEPYYFNHAWESSPVTLFYDGHVETIGTRNTMRADGRMRVQTGNDNWGLWSKDTSFGADGYLIQYGYDQAATSYHILTTDGIRGRDITAD